MMWWALGVTGVMGSVILALALHARSLARQLGKAKEENEQLKADKAWAVTALARHANADPDLDELDRLSGDEDDADRESRIRRYLQAGQPRTVDKL